MTQNYAGAENGKRVKVTLLPALTMKVYSGRRSIAHSFLTLAFDISEQSTSYPREGTPSKD
jgi:hypothetical protein